jgi:hypothetical protein
MVKIIKKDDLLSLYNILLNDKNILIDEQMILLENNH